MATHVALLRGINVGGRNKVPMAELRQVVTSLGHTGVTTYIQTGNVLFSPASTSTTGTSTTGTSSTELASALESAITAAFGVRAAVVVVTRDELAAILKDNPYPEEPNPKLVHVVFLGARPPKDLLDRIAAAESVAAAKGARDTVTAIGRALFVHTPDGYGNSELAQALFRVISAPGKQKNAEGLAATARNWVTATKLLALCDEK